MGRVKLFSGICVVAIVILLSVLLPVTVFAKTQVRFVIRMPWETKIQKKRVSYVVSPVQTLVTTKTPVQTPTATPIPEPSPTPIPEPTATPTIQSIQEIPHEEKTTNLLDTRESEDAQQTYTDIDTYVLLKVNEYRRQNGLSEISSDPSTCEFASLRAGEISSNFSHDGFNSRISSNTLPYPNYSYVNENIAQNSDFTRVTTSWIASPPHADNLRQNLTHACIRHSGEYFVFEGWRK